MRTKDGIITANTTKNKDEQLIVYLVYKNSDTIEGRGPMILDCCFLNKVDADGYIDEQPGIMGRKGKWSEKDYGDWRVEPIVVCKNLCDKIESDRFKIKQRAMSKLTQEEKEALGID